MNTVKFDAKEIKVIAHRGLSGLERENTNAAFVAAGNRNYFGIETDVHVTKDGFFAIHHDDNTVRVFCKDIIIEECSFSDLKDLRALDKGDDVVRSDLCVPSLSEYIRICKKYEKIAVLELKNPMEPMALDAIMSEIDLQKMLNNTIIISFDWGNCIHIRKKYKNQKIQYLRSSWEDDIISKLKENKLDFDINHTQLTKERLHALHANSIEVNVWTVDDKARAEELALWGVDYITTNILEWE